MCTGVGPAGYMLIDFFNPCGWRSVSENAFGLAYQPVAGERGLATLLGRPMHWVVTVRGDVPHVEPVTAAADGHFGGGPCVRFAEEDDARDFAVRLHAAAIASSLAKSPPAPGQTSRVREPAFA